MKMWKFFQKTKGVISVFLIMIMVPLFTSAVLMVDGTRYQSAKTLTQEANDLAAYSVVANYNTDLKDEFGLFAIDDPDLSGTFKKYVSETLGYSAAEGSYSDKVQNWISSSLFGGGDYAGKSFCDLYNFQVDSAIATPIHPLSDPGVLQNQIVEFTKYRAVETALERFELLQDFGQAKNEINDSKDTVAAVKDLSVIEERYVSDVSREVANIYKKVNGSENPYYEGYNDRVASISALVTKYCDAATEELAELAVNSEDIYQKKEARKRAFEELKNKLDSIVTLADDISGSCQTVKAWASQAKGSLETFIQTHPEEKYKSACDTARQDIEMLDKLLLDETTKYNLDRLRSEVSKANAEALQSSVISKINKMEVALQKAYTKYQSDLNKTDDKESVRYHVMLKSDKEWFATENNNTSGDADDFLTSAQLVVTEYVGYNFENGRIGTVNLNSYKSEFSNIFFDTADQMTKDYESAGNEIPDLKSEDAVNKANNAKANGTQSKPTYKTISNADAALLPSKCAASQSEMDIPDLSENNVSGVLNDAEEKADSVFGQFFESTRNDILVYAYLFDNFKTRVTGQNINSSTDKSGVDDQYLVDWRYVNSDGERDMRDRAKSSLATFFGTNEVEYVFGGCKSEAANASIVYSWIYGTRFVNNFAAVFSAYSSGTSWIRPEIDALAAAASAATFGAVPFSVFKWIFITALVAGETALDLTLLIEDGYRIPLIKTKDNIFLNSIFEIGSAFTRESRKHYLSTHNGGDGGINKLTVCYEDYLLILLAFVGRETRLERIGDLIQLNMRTRCDSSFTMSNAPTYIKADTTTRIKFLFQPFDMFKGSYPGAGLKYSNTIYMGY